MGGRWGLGADVFFSQRFDPLTKQMVPHLTLFYDIQLRPTTPKVVLKALWGQYMLIVKGSARRKTHFFGQII